MKNLIPYFLLFLGMSLYSQNNSGIVNYKVLKKEVLSNEIKDKGYKAFSDKIEKSAVELEFILKFNKRYSLFALKEGLVIDENDMMSQFAIKVLRGSNLYFTDRSQSTFFENTSFLDQKFSIKYKFEDFDWVIAKETKKIENYLCYKAYFMRPFFDRNGNKKYSKIIAWFTTEIGYNYGPFEAVGLPGLVLEFHSGKYIFMASNISMKKNMDINKPSMNKIISKVEFDSIQKEKFLELKN